jgi:molybdate-binding protein/transcriptional regulator with XRE-family HTH domain
MQGFCSCRYDTVIRDMNVSSGNQLSRLRRERGWSQQELAKRGGVSRAEVSAVENARLSPSIATALALARALGRSVEEVFEPSGAGGEAAWAFPPRARSGRFWEARVGARRLLYPVEPSALGVVRHDGTFWSGRSGSVERAGNVCEDAIVIAGCDPAIGLLAWDLLRVDGLRVIALTRSSRDALSLLERGLVHAAGVHWFSERRRDGNASVVSTTLGSGYALLHLARWQEGVALAPSVRPRSASALARSRIRWVGREEGSGARQCLDRILGKRTHTRGFRHVASDHRGVAQAVAGGWADAGVAVRLAAEEAGLAFIAVQQEDYELCIPDALRGDRALVALGRALRSGVVRKLYRDLPGYDTRRMGEERVVG